MRKLIALLLMATTVISLSACSKTEDSTKSKTNSSTTNEDVSTSSSNSSHILGVTAITEVYGDGQKVSAVAVQYDQKIDNKSLNLTDYTVDGQTITKVYANTEAVKASKGTNGNYVIIELKAGMTASPDEGSGAGGNGGPGGKMQTPPDGSAKQGTTTDKSTTNTASGTTKSTGTSQSTGGAPSLNQSTTSTPLSVTATQSGDIATTDRQTYAAASTAIKSTKTINLIVDDFKQLVYTDSNYNNEKLMYNLYVPADYDASKSYPLVLFMHDSSVSSTDPTKTLTQGIGATIWASPEEQAKHECIVLAPQYSTTIANDDSETTEYMDMTIDLLKELETQYSIDTNRIYNTGQSMGGMTSIAMDIKYPDIFAASYLVACQWDASLVSPMVNDNLWIVVCEGDTKASPGMDAITKALEGKGATVSSATWNPLSTTKEFATQVSAMMAENTNIKYTTLTGGNHMYTWKVAYNIEGIRDWLFAQVKK